MMYQHQTALTKQPRQARKLSRLRRHQQVSLVPAPQRSAGGQQRIAPQTLGQAMLHAAIPPLRHAM